MKRYSQHRLEKEPNRPQNHARDNREYHQTANVIAHQNAHPTDPTHLMDPILAAIM